MPSKYGFETKEEQARREEAERTRRQHQDIEVTNKQASLLRKLESDVPDILLDFAQAKGVRDVVALARKGGGAWTITRKGLPDIVILSAEARIESTGEIVLVISSRVFARSELQALVEVLRTITGVAAV